MCRSVSTFRTVILCLYMCCVHVEGHDIPLVPDQILRFKSGDSEFKITLRLQDLPASGAERWSATFYCSTSGNARTTLWGPLALDTHRAEDIPYSSPLHENLNNATLHLEMRMSTIIFYDVKIATLIYDENRPEPPHRCLQQNACLIHLNRWERKVVIVEPAADEILFSERDTIVMVCKSAHSSNVIWFNRATGTEVAVNRSILVLDKSFAGAVLQCAQHFLDKGVIRTVKSERSISFKYRITTEPAINDVTYYRVGDIFEHTCCGRYDRYTPTVRWVQGKDNLTLASNTSSASIRLVLDESYDKSYIECYMSVLAHDPQPAFEDVDSVSTRLVLIAADKDVTRTFGLEWFTVAAGVAAAALAAVLAASAYRCWRRRRCDVEVENELYVSDGAVVYAQLYEQRQGAPPPGGRLEYAKIIGHLQGNN